jgi:hypothetical protein
MATTLAISSPAVAAPERGQRQATSLGPSPVRPREPGEGTNKSPDSKLVPARASEAPSPSRSVAAPVRPFLLVHIASAIAIRSRPGGGTVVGFMPSRSKYLRTPTVAWVLEVSANGDFGKVSVPYSGARRTGWIALKGLERDWTGIKVVADLSRHRITVSRLGEVLFAAQAATGAPVSPTPPGSYFVTDRVATGNPSGSFGFYAFGISGIQTNLPPGWGGGDQLAIHGTNDPGSIGQSASAGCLRVSASTLQRLLPLLRLGTPVVVQR